MSDTADSANVDMAAPLSDSGEESTLRLPVKTETTNEAAEIPKTPSKKKRGPNTTKGEEESPAKKTRTPTSNSKAAKKAPVKTEGDADDSSATAAPSKGKAKGIPKSWDEADKKDRLLVTMKQDGSSMADINAMWERETGIKPSRSSLSVRYIRLKDNLARLDDGDDVKLLDAEQQWEKELNQIKFQWMSDTMQKYGCKKYTQGLLVKEFKRIKQQQADGTWVPTAKAVTKDSDEANEEDDDAGDEGNNATPEAVKPEPLDEDETAA